MFLNLKLACNFLQVKPNTLQTPITSLSYNQKSKRNDKKPASSFRVEYADV